MEWLGDFNADARPLEPTPAELHPVYYGVQTDKKDRGVLHVLVWSRGAKYEIER
jgi:hypothetical protein